MTTERPAGAAGRVVAAVLFAVALIPPLAVAWPLWDLVGGQRGLVLAASSLWVTATVEVVGYYLALAWLRGAEDPWSRLRPLRTRIKWLAWTVALADLGIGALLVVTGSAPVAAP